MKKLLLAALLLLPSLIFGQIWIDTMYSIQTQNDVVYGTATDFAGASQDLELDISYPLGDVPPACGRPLLVMIHGGGWFAGDKNDGYAKRIREDFAKRGYTTVSVNYRMGLFHTNQYVNCNVPDWNCWNMTDSSEWYRANHRAVQDVKGAIRYMVNHAGNYSIDANNVFVVGESAGGFIAMSVGFLDNSSEVLTSLTATYPNAPAPNSLYENNCIKNYGLAADIASMNLGRPDLGSHEGTLNLPVNTPYRIRGVGNFYGGAFNNIFQTFGTNSPSLYLFHQPCDLIVPFNYSRLLAGYNTCLSNFPANCGYIVNRPFAYGSKGIKTMIDNMVANSIPTTDYYYDNTTNNYNCLQQATNSSLACHAIDNYWLRTTNMATFFAGKIEICTATENVKTTSKDIFAKIFPNPVTNTFTIQLPESYYSESVQIFDITGRQIYQSTERNNQINVPSVDWAKGIYFYRVRLEDGILPAPTARWVSGKVVKNE
jgi:predicted esterase